MDLNTVLDVRDARAQEPWRPGDAWLGGGTYLFLSHSRNCAGWWI